MTVTPRSASSVSKRVDCFVPTFRWAEEFCSIPAVYDNYRQYLKRPNGRRDDHRYRVTIRLCRMLPKGQILARLALSPIAIQALQMRDLRQRGIYQNNTNLNGSFVPHCVNSNMMQQKLGLKSTQIGNIEWPLPRRRPHRSKSTAATAREICIAIAAPA